MTLIAEEVQLTRDALRYGFAVGKIRVLETRSVDRAALERLLDASSFTEQRRLLSEGPYGRFLEGAETAEAVERGLDAALDSWFEFLGEAALPEQVASYFTVQYDYNNLRSAAKARLLGAPLDGLLTSHGAIDVERFSADLGALPDELGETARSLPGPDDETDEPVGGRLVALDDAVDSAMFAKMSQLAAASRSEFLARYTALRIDLANVRTLVRGTVAGFERTRVEGSLHEGGAIPVADLAVLVGRSTDELLEALAKRPELRALPTENLADPDVLDMAVESLALDAITRGRRGPIGPEPVIAYVLARQVEVATLRVLLLGKLAGTDSETLRARVHAITG